MLNLIGLCALPYHIDASDGNRRKLAVTRLPSPSPSSKYLRFGTRDLTLDDQNGYAIPHVFIEAGSVATDKTIVIEGERFALAKTTDGLYVLDGIVPSGSNSLSSTGIVFSNVTVAVNTANSFNSIIVADDSAKSPTATSYTMFCGVALKVYTKGSGWWLGMRF